jgi:antitoxin PrlF
MEYSRVSSRGQVVIPKAVREALDLREGDNVAFIYDDGKLILQPLPQRSVQEAVSQITPRPALVNLPFEELLEAEKRSAGERRARGRG